MESVRKCAKDLWEMISKCVQYSVKAVRKGAECLWEMISNCAEKLCELIRKCATESFQALLALSQKIRKLIHSYVYPCVQASYRVVDEAYCRVKPFYDNLPENLKDSMNQAKKNTYESWKSASQMESNLERSPGSVPDTMNLFSSLIECFKNVKTFFFYAKEASEITRSLYKGFGKENEHVSVLIESLINALWMVSTILSLCGNDRLRSQIKKLESLCEALTNIIAGIVEVIRDIICTIIWSF